MANGRGHFGAVLTEGLEAVRPAIGNGKLDVRLLQRLIKTQVKGKSVVLYLCLDD
jgi:hypothetical protein